MTGALAGLMPDADAGTAALLSDLDRALSARPQRRVLMAVYEGASVVPPEVVRNAYPGAEVEVVDLAERAWRRQTRGDGRLDVVLDGTRDPEARVGLFDLTFPPPGAPRGVHRGRSTRTGR